MPVPGEETLSPTFRTKLQQVARRLGTDPQHLLGVMSWETQGTFSPSIRNQAGSGATGLIQFMPATARGLGTSTAALARMTPEEQLDYVEKYLTPYRGKLGTFQDTYMAVLYPQAMGKGPDTTLFRGGTTAYQQNAGLDEAGRGRVTVGDTMRRVGRFLGAAVSPTSAAAATLGALPDLPDRPAGAVGRGALPDLPDLPDAPPAAPAQAAPAAPAETFPPLAEQEAAASQQALFGAPPAPLPAQAPASPQTAAPGYDVDVQALGPPGTYQGPRAPGAGPGAVPPRAPASPSSLPAGVLQTPTGGIDYNAYLPGPNAMPLAEVAKMGAATGQSAIGTWSGATLGARIGGSIGGAPGAAIGGVIGGLGGAYIARRANVQSGFEPEGTAGDVLSVAIPAAPALWGGAKAIARGVTKWSRAGQAIQQADEAARMAQQTYQEGVATAAKQTAAQREAAVAQQQQREAAYQQRLRSQQARAASAHQTREAQRAAQVQERQASAVQQAEAQTAAQEQAYGQQVQQYEQAVTGQRAAVATARTLPGRYGPETPARTLYNQFRDLAPDAQVPLTQVQETAAGIQSQVSRGFETVTPTRLQAILDEVQRLPEVVDGLTTHRLMQDIGPLTRSPNSQIRGAAKQLYAGFQDALEKGAAQLPETAEARQVLLAANRAARREFALDDVQRIVRRATSRTPEGNIRFNAARALDQLDRLYEENALFRGSWTPEEWQGLTGQVGELTQVPRIPARPGAPPAPVEPRLGEPYTEAPMQPPAPPARRAPYTAWKPDVPGPAPPAPGVPTMPAASPLATSVRTLLRGAGVVDLVLGLPGPIPTVVGADAIADVVGHLLLRQDGQRYLRALLQADGTVNLQALIALAGGRAALQREERGTATPQEAAAAVGTLRARYAP